MAHLRHAECEGRGETGKEGVLFCLRKEWGHQAKWAVGEALALLSLTS